MYRKENIKGVYRTKKDNIDADLIIPLLNKARKYDRGTGFFSVEALANLSEGLIPYVRNNGTNTKIRIITSVELSPEDQAIIQNGENIAKEKTLGELEVLVEKEVSEQNAISLDLITNLIAANMLEIKIAYLNSGGIYHEKIGIFEDFDGDKVCFIGSQNETYSGYKRNVESLVTLKSWREGDLQDIEDQELYFDGLWNGVDEDINVVSFPQAVKQRLFSKYKYSVDIEGAISRIEASFSTNSRSEKNLYPYQEKAISEFADNSFCHFFEMATGTGKTFTAVRSIKRISNEYSQLYIVVLVPQIDLQSQWEEALIEDGYSPYLFGGNSKDSDWYDSFNRSVIDYYSNDEPVVSVCIYDTFFSKINGEINKADMSVFIIVDEAHELSPNQIKQLPERYLYRLGLSATPERHNLDETDAIIKYFTKGIVKPFEYSIDEAIANGFLSHYLYYPIFVRLSDDEFKQYKGITQQIIMLYNQDPIDREAIKDKLQSRGVIVKKASGKIDKLRQLIAHEYEFKNSVVYCGQGKDDDEEKIIDVVSRILKNEGRYAVSHFTSRTENRKVVLAEFEKGYYDTLVAIKCFDQGVDVPKLDKIYIMASDSLMRQTIQRRGRVLRKCKETGKQIAYIYDMVVLPPDGIFDGVGASALVRNELRRVEEYRRLADNIQEFEQEIDDLKQIYDAEGIYDDEE